MTAPTLSGPDGTDHAWTQLRRGLKHQSNVILALMFKDFRSRASSGRLGLMWIIVDPMTKILFMSAMLWLSGRVEVAGVNVALFVAVAIIPFTIISRSMGSVAASITANQAFYNYPQVKPIDALIARFVLDTVIFLLGAIVIFFGFSWFFDLHLNLHNILPIILILLVTMALAFGLALFNGTYGCLYDGYAKIASFFSRPLIFISAIFFTPNDLPAEARYYLSWNPIAQLVEYLRHYALGIRLFPEASMTYTILFSLIALFLGFLAYYPNRFKMLER